MSARTISVELPEPVYRSLERAAALTYRSVDDLVLSALGVTLSLPPDINPEIYDELAAMEHFSDAALTAASKSSLSPSQQTRLQQLNQEAGAHTLTPSESNEQTQLIELYQRAVLRRARALALLQFRGYSLSDQTAFDLSTADDDAENS